MIIKEVTFCNKDLRKIKMLYKEAFPKEERIPFWLLMLRTRFRSANFLAFYDKGRLCGIACLASLENLTNILYLAVDGRIRSRGYGSRILKLIRKLRPGHTITLDIETADTKADNSEQRKRRKEFYLRNGFSGSGYGYSLFGMDYEILKEHGSFKPDQWRKLSDRLSFGTLKISLLPYSEFVHGDAGKLKN